VKGPLKPGTLWQDWQIQQVLAWGQSGGLYRVVRQHEKRLLKELSAPGETLEKAVAGWRQLNLPQAIEVEEVQLSEGRLYLLMPELSGQPLSLADRAVPPGEALLLTWAGQICDLVLALQAQANPLALTLLEPDHILRTDSNELVVFNPGWSQLGSPLSVSQGLHKFARLMVFCATGKICGVKPPPDLPPALLWMVTRCLQDEYTTFTQLRQSLQTVALEETRSARSRKRSLDEFSIGDLPKSPPVRPLSRRLKGGLALLSLMALVGLGLALRRSQSKFAHPPGLALAHKNRLAWLSSEGVTIAQEEFPRNITCLLSSLDGELVLLGIEGQTGLTVVDRRQRKPVRLEGGAPPFQLLLSPNGQTAVGLLKNGNLSYWKLTGGQVLWQGEAAWQGSTLGARLAALRDDGGVAMVLPGRGLTVLDSQGKEEKSDFRHPGLTGALFLDPLLVAVDSRQGLLLALESNLDTVAQQKLPGLTQIYRDSYRRQLWAVEQRGLVSLWSVPALAPLGRLQLPGAPLCATNDPSGRLWTITQSGRLCRLDSQPLSCQQLGQVGAASALVYLAQPLPATGLTASPVPTVPR